MLTSRRYADQAMVEAFGPTWADHLVIESSPVGSGCVAQVYKGKLVASSIGGSKSGGSSDVEHVERFSGAWADGKRTVEQGDAAEQPTLDVAVKVVHPAVRDYITRDLVSMYHVPSALKLT